ncbi:unnamed protein product [Symbiodinium microadriaticum]|nr:unnamed protein product [Symbiodinium microadriaticum]
MVAPHVAALIAWLETLDRGNVAVHVQLPPVLTPLREILDQILRGQPGDVTMWARLVAVAEAFEALVTGNVLTHPADVVGQSQGEMESPLMCIEGTVPNWYRAVETLRALLQEVPQWPVRVLPTLQQAATNLVRGIAIATPAEERGGELPTADTRVRRSLTHTPAASSSGFDCQEAGARPLRAASADSVLRFPGGQRGQDLASLDRDAIKVVLTKGLQVKTRVQDPLPEEN